MKHKYCCWCNEKESKDEYQMILFGKHYYFCSAYCLTMVGVNLGSEYIEKTKKIGCPFHDSEGC